MKKWKKLLACLLASLMALAVFTACDGSAGVPIGPKHSDASSAKALCEQLGMTYSEELSDKAYSIANWVSATSVSCSANTNKTELYRVGSANDIAKTNLLQHKYATAFESMVWAFMVRMKILSRAFTLIPIWIPEKTTSALFCRRTAS